MRLKLATYLLIFLSLSTQFDDAWVLAVCADSQTAAEDDEYLLPSGKQLLTRSALVLPGHKAAEFLSARLDDSPVTVPALTVVFGPPPLYVFMSLQC
jgi:hypothetical protein